MMGQSVMKRLNQPRHYRAEAKKTVYVYSGGWEVMMLPSHRLDPFKLSREHGQQTTALLYFTNY